MRALAIPLGLLLIPTLLSAASMTIEEFRKQAVTHGQKYLDQRGAAELKKGLALAQKDFITTLESAGLKHNPYVKNLKDVVANAPLLQSWAQKIASGEPAQMLEAQKEMTLKLGEGLAEQLKHPYVKAAMKKALAGKDLAAEGAGALALALEGDLVPGARLVGSNLLNLTPAAPVIAFYQSAWGTMEYAKGEFLDNKTEDLYQDFASGKIDEQQLRGQLNRAGAHFLIRDRLDKLRKQKISEIEGTGLKPGDRGYERYTKVTSQMEEDRIVATFRQRRAADAQRRRLAEVRRQAQADYERIQAAIESEILEAGGDPKMMQRALDWLGGNFAERIQMFMETAPIFQDMHGDRNARLNLAARLMAARMLHRQNPDAYRRRYELERSNLRDRPEAVRRAMLDVAAAKKRNKTHKDQIRARVRNRLVRLSDEKLLLFLEHIGAPRITDFMGCLCRTSPGIGVGMAYAPSNGLPCRRSGFGETWYDLPRNQDAWERCLLETRIGFRKGKNQTASQGVTFDEYIANRLIELTK